ncbi:MAG: hypothetical protein ACRC5C_10505, partial [Bacilli bacterium]
IWSEKISIANRYYFTMEYETVKNHVRDAMILHSVPYQVFLDSKERLAKEGMILKIICADNVFGKNAFSHVSTSSQASNTHFRCVLARNEKDADEFIEHSRAHNEKEIGRMLGFNENAILAFEKDWANRYYDPVWQIAERSDEKFIKNKRTFLSKDGSVEKHLIRFRDLGEFNFINPCVRYLGARTIAHFPESFTDENALVVAKDWMQLADDLGVPGLKEVKEILSLPYEFDIYKGIGIVTTPVFKFVCASVNASERHVIQKESNYYPEESGRGMQFPFKVM